MNKLITFGILLALGGGGGYYYYNSTKKPEIPEFAKVTISEGEIVEEVSATGCERSTSARRCRDA
jgi:hypothetical protein